ncbi:MAG TPA: sensor histidine kinase [Candidatus Blautia pullistercoris]|uniref:Sensor histidine kinase n=1 Tax=Candidatus Blautia pullistercoris TaxID=2838499 RepID=A0A9D1VMI4_9FIRM|nr:sensor histidine kinase [Candidatus Blautia pullistercoris]
MKSTGTKKKRSWLLRKIMLIFVILSIVPTILIIVVANEIYSRSLYERSEQLISQNAKQHDMIVSERMGNYKDSFFELITEKDFINLAASINEEDKLYTADIQNMQTMLQSAVYSLSYVRSVVFIADNDLYVSYSKWYGRNEIPLWLTADSRQKIREDIKDPRRAKITSAYNLLGEAGQNDLVILLAMPVRNLMTKERSGLLIYAISNQMLLDQQGAANDEGVETVVTDADGFILNGTSGSAIGKNLTEYLEEQYKNKNYYKIDQEIDDTGWTASYIVDKDVQRRDVRNFNQMVLLLTLVIMGISFAVVIRFTGRYIGEIRKIGDAIENYDPDESRSLKVHLNQNDDLYLISHQFNRMVDRNNSLVEALKQKNNEIQEASERQKNAEIKALEAQINPHFLYNTLDSINWRAIDAGEEEISDMLGILGSLLRYSISNINGIVPLSVEIEWLKKYVFLQRERFNDSFDCVYDVAENCLDYPIYKMLLQPLIENSILHAFRETKEGGIITVKAFIREDQKLQISIKDNGSGMSCEQLENLRKNILEKKALDSRSIGISNVVNRLKIYYHDEAEIRVESELGYGTELVLVIPETKQSSFEDEERE